MDRAKTDFLAVLGFIYLQHCRPERAVTVFRALEKIVPDEGHYRNSLCYALLLAGEYDETLRRCDQVLPGMPEGSDRAFLQLMRGRALWGSGRKNEALQTVTQFLEHRRPDQS